MNRTVKQSILALACIGMLLPHSSLLASQPVNVTDVVLNGDVLAGQVVSTEGQPVAGAPVALYQGMHQVASVVSDREGRFFVNGMRSGTYHVVSGENGGLVRAWAANVAPPHARNAALVVSKSSAPVVRGGGHHHHGFLKTALIGAGMFGAGFGVGYAVCDDDDDASP